MNLERIDIIYVTYNSSEWIERCFNSYNDSLWPCEKIDIIVIDNGSTDDSLAKLEDVKNANKFASFDIFPAGKNTGFASACNTGFARGDSDIVCFFNIDTEIFPDTLTKLICEIENSDEQTTAWELRQFPYEHPKDYNVLTGETDWCSGAAFIVRREVFNEAGGFDERLFMYAEDVDLSFRLRALGYKLQYCPKSVILHHTYSEENEIKPAQYIYSVINNLLLRYRFGTNKDISDGLKMFRRIMSQDGPFKGSRKALAKLAFKQSKYILPFFCWRNSKSKKFNIRPTFQGFDMYTRHREGAYFKLEKYEERPLVSVIVRTHARPAILRETLISLRNQTYDNFEIIVIEDGEATARNMIETEFADLIINYTATEEHVGRSKAGNIGMEAANGEYINFLDDDDLFYADHIETTMQFLLYTGKKAAYSLAYETAINVTNTDPYEYSIASCSTKYRQPFNRLLLLRANYIPIQSMMFKKELFVNHGGLDTELDANEDYDMWIRYALQTDFGFTEKTTSIYRVPAVTEDKQSRDETQWAGFEALREKIKNYEFKVSAYEAGEEVIRIIEHFETTSGNAGQSLRDTAEAMERERLKGDVLSTEAKNIVRQLMTPSEDNGLFVSYREHSISFNTEDVKPIAFYLPQYHAIPENDEWWGKGFTEWYNVASAVPSFDGHYQPRLPYDVGFYDLSNIDVMKRQVELAKNYGVYGFCFYYYRFGAKKLLEKPLENYKKHKKDLDFPYCICWANENWSRRWDGYDDELLLKQEYTTQDNRSCIEDIANHFADDRYIRINGKPLIIIYRGNLIPGLQQMLDSWRKYCKDAGFGDIVIAGNAMAGIEDPVACGFDIGIDFTPNNIMSCLEAQTHETRLAPYKREYHLYDMQPYLDRLDDYMKKKQNMLSTVFPSWDNTARRKTGAHIYTLSPEQYKSWLKAVIDNTLNVQELEKRFVFINAWNEWAEGAHLEPDRRYGYAYLEATAEAVSEGQ